jgi:hypothetical protein
MQYIHIFILLTKIYSSSSESDQSAQLTGLGFCGLTALVGAQGHSVSALDLLGVRGDSSSDVSSRPAYGLTEDTAAVLATGLITVLSSTSGSRYFSRNLSTVLEMVFDAVQYLAKCPVRPHLVHCRPALVGQHDLPFSPTTLWHVTMVIG